MKNGVFWGVTPFIRVTRIGELGTTLAATSNRRKLRRNTTLGIHNIVILYLGNLSSICSNSS
jgi:hypothetical protein